MTWLEAIVLGVVQGLTEFLPVSSSGHLVLLQHFFQMKDAQSNLFVTAVLHLGSLGAILVYYSKDLVTMFTKRRHEIGLILLGSLPAAAIGLSLLDQIRRLYAEPQWVCAFLVVTGLFLWISERWGRQDHDLTAGRLGAALMIGIAQAVALLPGISRSGATIGTAYLFGIKRKEAVRFSFFLAIPVTAGAGVLELVEAVKGDVRVPTGPMMTAFVLCFAVSLGALKLLEMLAVRGKLFAFSIYCVLAGVGGGLVLAFS